MPVDTNYGRRTGVTSFKQDLKELCELLRKFESTIKTFINASSLAAGDKAILIAVITAVDAACGVIDLLPDD